MAGVHEWKDQAGNWDDDEDDDKINDSKSQSYEVPSIKRALAFLLYQEKFRCH
jgi:hypothetical protein